MAGPESNVTILLGKLRLGLSFGSPTFKLILNRKLGAFGSSNMIVEGLSLIIISDFN